MTRQVALEDVVLNVTTWNPLKTSEENSFDYIDISSVGQESKTIESPKQVFSAEAPSRARQLVKADDVIVSTVRPNLNAIAQVPAFLDGATASTGFCVLRSDAEKLDSRFLFHWVKSPQFVDDMTLKATGASYPAVSDRIIKESKIPLPPLPEQRRIAAILDKADALREKRRQSIAKLDALLQSVFIDMFGDPVTNPMRWNLVKVSSVVSGFQGGKSVQSESSEIAEFRYRVLKVSAVTSLIYKPEESKPLPIEYSPPSEHFVKTGDLLFSRANTSELVGAVAYVWDTPQNVLMPDKLWRFLWTDSENLEPLFICSVFHHPSFRYEIGKLATGTSGSMKNISQGKVLGMMIPMPELCLQKKYSQAFKSIWSLQQNSIQAFKQGEDLFQSLQQRAFTGEL